MFGNFFDGFLTKVNPNREFKLEKCEIALFNKVAYDLHVNFEMIREGAKEFEKSHHSRAYDCLYFCN